jgi:hypothetical protein
MDRQSVLERMGWIFTRIRGTEFLRNPERALKPVLEKLQLLEISPAAAKPDSVRKGTGSPGLIDRVVSRAEELRAAWSAPQESGAARPREPRHVLRNEYSAN